MFFSNYPLNLLIYFTLNSIELYSIEKKKKTGITSAEKCDLEIAAVKHIFAAKVDLESPQERGDFINLETPMRWTGCSFFFNVDRVTSLFFAVGRTGYYFCCWSG